MLPFVRANQDIALKLASTFAPTGSFQVRVRNLFMRPLPYMPWAPLIMRVAMRGVRNAAHAMQLPDHTATRPSATHQVVVVQRAVR